MRYIFVLLIILSSCSPRGFVYKDGNKEGVTFKRSISQKDANKINVYVFFFLSLLILK